MIEVWIFHIREIALYRLWDTKFGDIKFGDIKFGDIKFRISSLGYQVWDIKFGISSLDIKFGISSLRISRFNKL